MCVLAHDGRELGIEDLIWISRDGEPLSLEAALEAAAE
jgi:hypothetical protein